ncbi:hypothetical protein [Sphingomonas sp. CFBP 13733]|uniref:hypothetical protein n=1 Tax=Sphingomonas sp. CFBP 13733 TaxID=2775291 RepID=UPI00177F103C|nr:hypothetical protein [Sphingomonas sp. CFBP 13733]MBD8641264.1 hypothetical protein [Sphingomonas sp. CFBP 13733]
MRRACVLRASGITPAGMPDGVKVALMRDSGQKRTPSAPPRLRANQSSFFA